MHLLELGGIFRGCQFSIFFISMGSALSRDENDTPASASIPQQQIYSAILGIPVGINAPSCPLPTPMNLSVVKTRLGIMVKQDSISVEKPTNKSVNLCFQYYAAHEVQLQVFYEEFAQRRQIGMGSSTLGPTPADAGFVHYSIHTEVDFPTTPEPLHARVSLQNPDGSLDMIIEFSATKSIVRSMTFTNGTDVIQLIQLFNATSGPVSPSSVDHGSNKTCAVCLSSDASVGFLPCRHVCVCPSCAKSTLASSANHCPICRSDVTGTIRID